MRTRATLGCQKLFVARLESRVKREERHVIFLLFTELEVILPPSP